MRIVETIMDCFLYFFIFVVIILLLAIYGRDPYTRNHSLSYLPEEMKVSHALYAQEEPWFEEPWFFDISKEEKRGLIMYSLSKEIAAKLATDGINYLSSFTSANLREAPGWRDDIINWRTTPIPIEDDIWHKIPGSVDYFYTLHQISETTLDTSTVQGLAQFVDYTINREDREFSREPVLLLFYKVMETPGNFYAYGRSSIIVVAPSINRVFYLYVE